MASKTPWFDDLSDTPLIAEYARKLDSFLDAIADSVVETKELAEQEKRVVALMKEIEPLLQRVSLKGASAPIPQATNSFSKRRIPAGS